MEPLYSGHSRDMGCLHFRDGFKHTLGSVVNTRVYAFQGFHSKLYVQVYTHAYAHAPPTHLLGVLYWECYLAGRVIPDRCRMTVGKVRAEIKLKKVDPVQWTEYEVCVHLHWSYINTMNY